MRTKIVSFIAAFLLITTTTIVAQSLQLGFKGGVNLSNYNNDFLYNGSDGVDHDSRANLMLGIFADIPVTTNFSVQPEINYIEKGATLRQENDVYITRNDVTWQYLELPVLAKYRVNLPKGNFYMMTGPSVGYAVGGTQEVENWPGVDLGIGSEGGEMRITDDLDYEFRSEFDSRGMKDNRFDFGLLVGAGFEFNVGPGNFLLESRFGWDLTGNLEFEGPTPSGFENNTHRDWVVNIGYAFPIGK